MKKDEDFRIQKLLDQKMKGVENIAPEMVESDDLKAYELIYGHLNEKSVHGLSLSFKSNILRRIETDKKQANDSKFYWLLGFVFLLGIIVITSLFLVFKDAFTLSLSIIGRSKGLIVIGIVAIFAFNFVEKSKAKL